MTVNILRPDESDAQPWERLLSDVRSLGSDEKVIGDNDLSPILTEEERRCIARLNEYVGNLLSTTAIEKEGFFVFVSRLWRTTTSAVSFEVRPVNSSTVGAFSSSSIRTSDEPFGIQVYLPNISGEGNYLVLLSERAMILDNSRLGTLQKRELIATVIAPSPAQSEQVLLTFTSHQSENKERIVRREVCIESGRGETHIGALSDFGQSNVSLHWSLELAMPARCEKDKTSNVTDFVI